MNSMAAEAAATVHHGSQDCDQITDTQKFRQTLWMILIYWKRMLLTVQMMNSMNLFWPCKNNDSNSRNVVDSLEVSVRVVSFYPESITIIF
jgi:hypothetical protein